MPRRRFLCFAAFLFSFFVFSSLSMAQVNLSKMWRDWNYPKVRTYPAHTGLGPNYAVDFFFTARDHADLYMNGENPTADGLAGVPILAGHGGSGYILLYDITNYGYDGNFPAIDAERVIAGQDTIPKHSFSFVDQFQVTRKIDVEFVVDSLSLSFVYAHLRIDDRYFDLPGVEQTFRSGVDSLFNSIARICGSDPVIPRVPINLGETIQRGDVLGFSDKWGVAQDEHLHFQIFDGGFPPCFGSSPLNLADANEVVLNGQVILDSNFSVNDDFCEGGYCIYYPAMKRNKFLPGQTVFISASWDDSARIALRNAPGGDKIRNIDNYTVGMVTAGPIPAFSGDDTYRIWLECQFAGNTGWVPSEYLSPINENAGSVVAWGDNHAGQCDVPMPNNNFVAVAGGGNHSVGLKSDGSIVVWGSDGNGQHIPPYPNFGFVSIAAGGVHSLAVKNNTSIIGWGGNYYHECEVPEPNNNFVGIDCGRSSSFSLGLKSYGSVLAWGYCANGQCNVPDPNTNFIAVSAGYSYSLGLKSDGSIIGWGENSTGQCDVPEPNNNFVAVVAGFDHGLGLKNNGSIVAWGYCDYGVCDVPEPNSDFVAISAGVRFSLALKNNGSIVAWGNNIYGQCDVPYPNSGFTAISAGSYYSLALQMGGVSGISEDLGRKLSLSLCGQPNPFSEGTRLRYFIPSPAFVRLGVYDILGRGLMELKSGQEISGEHFVFWDGRSENGEKLPSGIYFVRVSALGETKTRQIILVR